MSLLMKQLVRYFIPIVFLGLHACDSSTEQRRTRQNTNNSGYVADGGNNAALDAAVQLDASNTTRPDAQVMDAQTQTADAGNMMSKPDAGPCVPQCKCKQCGDDGCGGSCGECTMGQTCNSRGMCGDSTSVIDHKMTIRKGAAPRRPTVGACYSEPNFGTALRRVSNRSEVPVEGDNPGQTHLGGYETQIYSQLQAFSADNSHILLVWDAWPSLYAVRKMSDFSLVQGIDLSGANAPRWHPKDADKLVHWDTNADNILRFQETSVSTKQTTSVATLSDYKKICGNESWEELSHDGTWVVGMAQRANTNWDGNCRDYPTTNDVFSYNLKDGRYGARINLETLNSNRRCNHPDTVRWIDWVAVSPLGDYILIQWVFSGTSPCNGLEVFDIETGAYQGRLTDHTQHGDLGLVEDWQNAPANQKQFFMTFEWNNGPDNNDFPVIVGYSYLPGTATGRANTNSTSIKLASGLPDHISCQGPAGYCLVTTGPGDGPNSWSPFEEEVFITDLTGNVNRLTHHQSSECAYWAQPRATWSRDGQYAIFSSDWGNNSCNVDSSYPDWLRLGRVDPYVIHISP